MPVNYSLIEQIPWVLKRNVPVSCDGIKWSQVALKHLYPRGNKPAEGIPDQLVPPSDTQIGDI